jgi:ribose/xylose/arabinose/galactoside ABC-type transport system permease subunit
VTRAVTSDPPVAVAADHGGREAARARARALTSLISRNGAVAVLVLVVVLGTLLVPTFARLDNLRNVALAASFIGIIAAGMTFVIISGGIDLSVGSTYALAVILSASLAQYGSFAAVAGALVACGFAGLVQGVVVSFLRLPPFIVTLAGLTGIRGLVYFITHEGNDHPSIAGFRVFETLGTGRLATLGTPVWIMLAVFAIGWWVLNRTAFGQSVQAIGGNDSAAELMGLPVKRATTLVYVVSGLWPGSPASSPRPCPAAARRPGSATPTSCRPSPRW